MVAEFIRLRHDADRETKDQNHRVFVCELPDITDENSRDWINCGRVTAAAAAGMIRRVTVELGTAFFDQLGDDEYDPEEVLRVILLSLAWEKWLPLNKVHVILIDGNRTIAGMYLAEADQFRWKTRPS